MPPRKKVPTLENLSLDKLSTLIEETALQISKIIVKSIDEHERKKVLYDFLERFEDVMSSGLNINLANAAIKQVNYTYTAHSKFVILHPCIF